MAGGLSDSCRRKKGPVLQPCPGTVCVVCGAGFLVAWNVLDTLFLSRGGSDIWRGGIVRRKWAAL